MVGRLLSYWEGKISGAMLNFRWVMIFSTLAFSSLSGKFATLFQQGTGWKNHAPKQRERQSWDRSRHINLVGPQWPQWPLAEHLFTSCLRKKFGRTDGERTKMGQQWLTVSVIQRGHVELNFRYVSPPKRHGMIATHDQGKWAGIPSGSRRSHKTFSSQTGSRFPMAAAVPQCLRYDTLTAKQNFTG